MPIGLQTDRSMGRTTPGKGESRKQIVVAMLFRIFSLQAALIAGVVYFMAKFKDELLLAVKQEVAAVKSDTAALRADMAILLKNDVHLFGSNLITTVAPSVLDIGGATAVCLRRGNHSFLVSAAHVLPSHEAGLGQSDHFVEDELGFSHSLVDLIVLNATVFAAGASFPCLSLVVPTQIRRGDALVSLGFYKSELWTWNGQVQFIRKCDSRWDAECLFVDAAQRMGMSGSPVFNGCGLAGIGNNVMLTPVSTNKDNQSAFYFAAGVVHVAELVKLLDHASALRYALPQSLKVISIDIPTKSYCN